MALQVDPELREIAALRQLVDFRGREVVEIGCGDGRLTFRYAEQVQRVYGFDQFFESIVAARQNTPRELHGKVEFYVGGAEQLSLPSERFDIALLAWSL